MASNDDDDSKRRRAQMCDMRTVGEAPHKTPSQRATPRLASVYDYVLAMVVSCAAGVIFALLPVATVHATVQPQSCPGFSTGLGEQHLWSVAPFALEKSSSDGSIAMEEMEEVWTEFRAVTIDGPPFGISANDGETLLNTAGDVGSDPAGTHSITVNRFQLTVGEYP